MMADPTFAARALPLSGFARVPTARFRFASVVDRATSRHRATPSEHRDR
jgi:hypothetical protein